MFKLYRWFRTLFQKLQQSPARSMPLALFDLYFAQPNSTPAQTSILYAARRDAAQCLGYDPNSYMQGIITIQPTTYAPVLSRTLVC